ncbi:MAG: hypothetical protein NT080_06545 [Spirochaetes bacterium]|nr:hypothetical protein [Spirochaetota bacterium]
MKLHSLALIPLVLAIAASCAGKPPAATPDGSAAPAADATSAPAMTPGRLAVRAYAIKEVSDKNGVYFDAMVVTGAIARFAAPVRYVRSKAGVELSNESGIIISAREFDIVVRNDEFILMAISGEAEAAPLPSPKETVTVRFGLDELRKSRFYKDDPGTFALQKAASAFRKASGSIWLVSASFDPGSGFRFIVAFVD